MYYCALAFFPISVTKDLNKSNLGFGLPFQRNPVHHVRDDVATGRGRLVTFRLDSRSRKGTGSWGRGSLYSFQ